MRLATLSNGNEIVVGIEKNASFYRWNDVVIDRPTDSLLELVRTSGLEGANPQFAGVSVLGPEFKLLAPFPRPTRNIICLGKNYAAHAEEFAKAMDEKTSVPAHPIVFSKATTTVTAPEATVTIDSSITQSVDYEVELAIVIGKRGRHIARSESHEYIAGYTVINDLTARDLQQRHAQWFLGKSLDGFCPMGPVFVTSDEIGDPTSLTLSLKVDGELRQNASVKDMIFDIPEILATLSTVLTLEPGDIIATGTPEGVAVGFDPPRFLQHGSVVEASIDRIGTLRNRIEFVGGSESTG